MKLPGLITIMRSLVSRRVLEGVLFVALGLLLLAGTNAASVVELLGELGALETLTSACSSLTQPSTLPGMW